MFSLIHALNSMLFCQSFVGEKSLSKYVEKQRCQIKSFDNRDDMLKLTLYDDAHLDWFMIAFACYKSSNLILVRYIQQFQLLHSGDNIDQNTMDDWIYLLTIC